MTDKRPLRYLSVCSGIEAATVAWHELGWTPVAFSEIEPFSCALLKHHYPHVPNWGDMTKFQEWPDADVDVLVGGTPCQSFSVAGLRQGLADPRGNLMLTFLAIIERYKPKWVVWENVPGVLSSNGGRDFGAFLGGLANLGYGWAYRVFDAQYFGLAQRRKRVFVVGSARSWASAAAVLFERESLQGNPAPSRETREKVASSFAARARSGGGLGTDAELDGALIAHSLPAEGFDASEDGTGRGIPLTVGALTNGAHNAGGQFGGMHEELCMPLTKNQTVAIALPISVRRLTPTECERLQGFPDGYTLIPHRGKTAADGPRYKALGNSMAVPVMAWISKRIQMVEDMT